VALVAGGLGGRGRCRGSRSGEQRQRGKSDHDVSPFAAEPKRYAALRHEAPRRAAGGALSYGHLRFRPSGRLTRRTCGARPSMGLEADEVAGRADLLEGYSLTLRARERSVNIHLVISRQWRAMVYGCCARLRGQRVD
jgi:hypothetical protein